MVCREGGGLLNNGKKGCVSNRIRHGKRLILCSLILFLTSYPARALAESPTGQLKGTVERVVEILARQDLKGEMARSERRALLRKEIRPLFLFSEMARRSLGSHWDIRTPAEREEFTDLFTLILEDSYLGKIESYGGGTIRYVEETVKPPRAVVKTVVAAEGSREVSADYRMLYREDRWRIYDVLVDGVSVLNNCRSQFGSMLRYYSFETLIRKLKEMPACRG
jgi:phospholipid transport system substrate-binding protein